MKRVVIIKYGELSTKSDNINFFLKTLKNNVDKKLEGFNYEIKYDHGRMLIFTEDVLQVKNKLQEVFGIHEICDGYLYEERSLESIKTNVLNIIKDLEFNTFKITVKRSDKNYMGTSITIATDIGAYVLKNIPNIKVDVTSPDINVIVEIRLNEVLIYAKGIPGLGGYPVSTLGKGLLMLSGGIDSPVAGYLAIKRGVKIEAVYFDSPPHTSPMALKKVEDLARVLAKYNGGEVKIHVVCFTKIQEEIIKNIPKNYLITMMRRMMYRISALICGSINAHAIINGESIGQVASQTLKSMQVINEAVKMPVLRPLCTYDKLEIIELSKKIGTYDISIRPYEDCCTIFVPEHPVINPDVNLAHEYETLVDFDSLVYEAIKGRTILHIKDHKENNFSDLL